MEPLFLDTVTPVDMYRKYSDEAKGAVLNTIIPLIIRNIHDLENIKQEFTLTKKAEMLNRLALSEEENNFSSTGILKILNGSDINLNDTQNFLRVLIGDIDLNSYATFRDTFREIWSSLVCEKILLGGMNTDPKKVEEAYFTIENVIKNLAKKIDDESYTHVAKNIANIFGISETDLKFAKERLSRISRFSGEIMKFPTPAKVVLDYDQLDISVYERLLKTNSGSTQDFFKTLKIPSIDRLKMIAQKLEPLVANSDFIEYNASLMRNDFMSWRISKREEPLPSLFVGTRGKTPYNSIQMVFKNYVFTQKASIATLGACMWALSAVYRGNVIKKEDMYKFLSKYNQIASHQFRYLLRTQKQ